MLVDKLKTPPQLSVGTSKFGEFEFFEIRSGIVLENADELRSALEAFAGVGRAKTLASLLEDKEDLPYAVGHATGMKSWTDNDTLKAIDMMVSSSKGMQGHYDNYYGPNYFGSPFTGTVIKIDRKGTWFRGPYILNIRIVRSSEDIEKELAQELGKQQVLQCIDGKARLSRIDDYWFQLDLADTFRDFKIDTRKLTEFAQKMVDGTGYSIPFVYKGNRFELEVGFRDVLKNRDRSRNPRPIRLRLGVKGNLQTAIIGNAYTIKNNTDVLVAEPYMNMTLSLSSGYAASDRDIKALQEAKTYIVETLKRD